MKVEKTRALLAILQPMPAEVNFAKLKHKDSENQATATLEPKVLGKDFTQESLTKTLLELREGDCDPSMVLTLWPTDKGTLTVDVKLEGSGEAGWKILIPTSPRLKKTVPRLKDRYGNYVRFLEEITRDVKGGKTAADVESELKRRLKEEAK